jgi:hypothetical protein
MRFLIIVVPAAALGLCVAFAFGASSDSSSTEQDPTNCKWELDPKSSPEECVTDPTVGSNGWFTCPCQPPRTGNTCCTHRHLPMSWNLCELQEVNTGKNCQGPTQKYYQVEYGSCSDCVCTYGGVSACTTHYRNDYTLIDC